MKRWQMAWWEMLLGLVLISVLLTSRISAQKLDYGALESFVELHGIIVQEYYDFEKDGDNRGIPTFDSRYAYLFIQCSLRENLKGVMEWKVDRGGEKIGIDRCYLDWKLHHLVGFRAGKLFYIPMISDVQDIRPTGNKLISSPLPSVFAVDVLFRDIGLEAYGEQSIRGMSINYQVAVSNGSMLRKVVVNADGTASLEETGRDDSPKKAFAANLFLIPMKGLELIGGYYQNNSNMILEMKTLAPTGIPGVNMVVTTQADVGELDLKVSAGSIKFSLNRLSLKGWYLKGTIDAKQKQKTGISGYMGEAAYQLLQKKHVNYMELVGRCTLFDVGLSKIGNLFPDMKTVTTSLGIGISPYEHFRIKGEYEWIKEKKGSQQDNDGFMLQVVIDY